MKIRVVRFKESMMVGYSMSMVSYLNDTYTAPSGEKVVASTIEGQPIQLSKHDDVFLCVTFPESKYKQLIPWSAVATVILEESTKK